MFTIPSFVSRTVRRLKIDSLRGCCWAGFLLLSGTIAGQTLTPTNGLVLWLKADAGITTNATGAVTAWADQSGQNNNAVQTDDAKAPQFIPTALNNKPALHFDGVDDYLDV